jgi:hypothetical protein
MAGGRACRAFLFYAGIAAQNRHWLPRRGAVRRQREVTWSLFALPIARVVWRADPIPSCNDGSMRGPPVFESRAQRWARANPFGLTTNQCVMRLARIRGSPLASRTESRVCDASFALWTRIGPANTTRLFHNRRAPPVWSRDSGATRRALLASWIARPYMALSARSCANRSEKTSAGRYRGDPGSPAVLHGRHSRK